MSRFIQCHAEKVIGTLNGWGNNRQEPCNPGRRTSAYGPALHRGQSVASSDRGARGGLPMQQLSLACSRSRGRAHRSSHRVSRVVALRQSSSEELGRHRPATSRRGETGGHPSLICNRVAIRERSVGQAVGEETRPRPGDPAPGPRPSESLKTRSDVLTAAVAVRAEAQSAFFDGPGGDKCANRSWRGQTMPFSGPPRRPWAHRRSPPPRHWARWRPSHQPMGGGGMGEARYGTRR